MSVAVMVFWTRGVKAEETAASLHREVETLIYSGKFIEAITKAQRAIKLAEKEFGHDHRYIGIAVFNIAVN